MTAVELLLFGSFTVFIIHKANIYVAGLAVGGSDVSPPLATKVISNLAD